MQPDTGETEALAPTNLPGNAPCAGCAAHSEAGTHTVIGVMLKGLFTMGGLHRCRTRARRATRTTIGRDYVLWALCAGFVMAYIR